MALRNAVDIDLSNLATKTDLAVLRGEFAALSGELEAKIERTKADLIKCVVGMGFAQVAMLIALLRLIPGIHP